MEEKKKMRMSCTSVFTTEEKEFILSNYVELGAEEISKILDKGKHQVKGYAENNGLKRGNKPRDFNKEEVEYIKKWYNVKENGTIAKDLGLTTKQVNDYGYRHIGKRDIVRYELDNTYFEKIDTEGKAYWLGFLYADGCINENDSRGYIKAMTLELGLCRKDKEHLVKLNNSLKSNNKIKDYIVAGKYESSKLVISNTKMCRDLIDKGCVPRKSLVLEFPSCDIVPSELIRHFIRGYFDGDGCISHAVNAKTPFYVFGFVGTRSLLESIQIILYKDAGLTKTKLSQKQGQEAYQIMKGGRNNCKIMFDYLYKDSTIYLDRKYDKFIKIINKEV